MHSHNASTVSDQTTYQHPQDTHHLWKHENSLTLHLLSESGFSRQKSWYNINTCFYKHLFKHAWRWRQYCTLKTTLPWSWLHFSTSCDHQAVRSAATCFCVLKQSHTQPAQHRLTSKCGKNCIARNPAKKCCFIHSKTTASSQRGKKTQQNYFLNYSQEVTETYLAWKSQESLRSTALYVK